MNRSAFGLASPPSHVLRHDVGFICDRARQAGYVGYALLIDEAHHLLGMQDTQQQIRDTLQHVDGCSIVFAGEPGLAKIFTDPSERLFKQGSIILLENFMFADDVSECAILPLTEDERVLMSPMTVGYLVRLARGKPDEIRLICHSIYRRFQRGDQSDLDITVETLDDVLNSIESVYKSDYDLTKQVNAIRTLNSVDLEALYAMTRFPHMSIDEVVELDEAFRGETYSERSADRRRTRLVRKQTEFVSAGLMVDSPDRFTLAGDEFLHLYLRFWFEVQKYGRLSRRLLLGKGTATLFGEKADKLVKSCLVDLGFQAEFVRCTYGRRDATVREIPESIRRRYSRLRQWMESRLTNSSGVGRQRYWTLLEA